MDKRFDHFINHDPYTKFFYLARGSKEEILQDLTETMNQRNIYEKKAKKKQ